MFLLKSFLSRNPKLRNTLHFIKWEAISFQEYLEKTSKETSFQNFSKIKQIKDLQEKKLDDRVTIYGIPLTTGESNDTLFSQLDSIFHDENKETDCFLQLDPSLHLFKKRKLYSFLNDKFVYKGVVDMKDEFAKENPCKLIHYQESLLEPAVIQYETQMKYQQIFEKQLQEKSKSAEIENKEELLKILSEVLQNNIEFPDGINFDAVLEILLRNHITQRNIFLSDIPAVYLRIILENTYSLESLLGHFKDILTLMKQNPMSIMKEKSGQLSLSSFSAMFFETSIENYRFFYLRCLTETLKQMGKKKNNIAIFLKMDAFLKYPNYCEVDDLEYTWEEAFNVPLKSDEPDEVSIEKHALLDLMFESNLWSKNYIGNPFPYISEDFHSLKEEDQKDLKKKFYVSYKKFEKIKTEFLK